MPCQKINTATYSCTLFWTESACLVVKYLAEVGDRTATARSGGGDKCLLKLKRVAERPTVVVWRKNPVVVGRKVINEIMVSHREDEVWVLVVCLLDVAGSMLLRPARQSPGKVTALPDIDTITQHFIHQSLLQAHVLLLFVPR